MGSATKIEWADMTFNPFVGCTRVGPGCDHCYAEAMAKRFGWAEWGPGKPRHLTSAANWHQPLKWDARAEREGRRFRVFCSSLADVFDNEVPPAWREDLFRLIGETPNLDWLLLTKRIGNVPAMVSVIPGWIPPNVWLGVTVVNQTEFDRDIPKLLAVPAAKRFLSMEPLLGPVDIRFAFADNRTSSCCHRCGYRTNRGESACPNDGEPLGGDIGIDWVIVGGESGAQARPMHPDWVRSLRNQCGTAGVPFFFKQWGEYTYHYDRDRYDPDWERCDKVAMYPGRWINAEGGHGFHGKRVHYAHRVGKKAAGRLLDGRTWDEVPR